MSNSKRKKKKEKKTPCELTSQHYLNKTDTKAHVNTINI